MEQRELITGKELAALAGVNYSRIALLKGKGLISCVEDPEGGRPMFDPAVAVAEIKTAENIVPQRKKREEVTESNEPATPKTLKKIAAVKNARVSSDEEECQEPDEVLDLFTAIKKRAFLTARKSYKNFILKFLDECTNNEEAAELELHLLRHYTQIDWMFEEIRP